jgi:hypothetical protein
MLLSPYLGGLRHLEITRTIFAKEDLLEFFQSPLFARLESLKLIDVGLQDEILKSIRQPIAFRALRQLDISHNALGDDGILLLSRTPSLEGIERIGLRHTYVKAPALRAFLLSPHSRGIRNLDAAENPLSAAEKAALADLARERNIQLTI